MMTKETGLIGKYVDICTDFGWKLYFGPDNGKQNLINFLNSLFEGERVIVDLVYQPTERNGDREDSRKVIFDLYCTCADNSHFIIEMQQLLQNFFKDRTVYYTSRLINTLIPKGREGNSYELPGVYFIGILDFHLDVTRPEQYYYDVALCDKESQRQFYDKLGYKLLVLPAFNKEGAAVKSVMDMWLYLFKHMSELQEMPKFLDKRVFSLIFDIGEVAKLKQEDMNAYELSLKDKRDAESVLLTARRLGHDAGLKEGELKKAMEIAREMKKNGIPFDQIIRFTKLPLEQIEKL